MTCRNDQIAKDTETLWPKGKGSGMVRVYYHAGMLRPRQKKRNLTHLVDHVERGKSVCLFIRSRFVVKQIDGYADMGGWRKPMPCCNGRDTGIIPGPKGSRLPSGSLLRENCSKI